MNPHRAHRARRTVLVLLVILTMGSATGCGNGPSADPAQLALPAPDLSSMDPSLAAWLEQRREVVEGRAQDGGRPAEEIARDFGELGQLYFVYGLPEAAETALGNARRLAPDEYRWVYLYAHSLRDRGDLDGASRAFEEALEIRPDSPAALVYFGDLQLERGRTAEAGDLYDRALKIRPDLAAALYGRGRVAAEDGDAEAAVRDFRRTLELEPQASTVHYQLAQAYRTLGRNAEAERHLALRGNDRVSVPDPVGDDLRDLKTLTAFQVTLSRAADADETDPQRLLDFFLTQLGDVEGTLEQLEAEISGRPEAAPATRARLHYLAGGLATYRRDDRRALAHFEGATRLDPGLLDAQVKLGNALARQRRFEEAARRYALVLADQPTNEDVAIKRATALINLGRGGEAAAELEDRIRRDPSSVLLRVRLAEALERMGRPADAEARLREARDLELPPAERAQVFKAQADFLARRERFDDALGAYRESLRLDPAAGAARRDYAALLGRLGRYDEAAREYAAAGARQPDEEAPRLGEAAALLLSGRVPEARERLEEGVARIPRSAALHQLLGRILAAAPEASLRDGDRALALARRAFELQASPAHAETVAMAHAERGEYDQAVLWQQRVLGNLPQNAPGRDDAFARLTLYRSGRAYRAPNAGALLP